MNMKTNSLIKWWNGRKENAKRKAIAAFKSDYKVSEKDGRYISFTMATLLPS